MIENIIKLEEESGVFKEKPYYCSEGFPTIGWGFKCGEKNQPLPKITMTLEQGEKDLGVRIYSLEQTFKTHLNTRHLWPKLSEVRQAALLSMAYQIGFVGLLKFRKMWVAIEKNNFIEAASEILNSLAAKQAPNRFKRNSEMMSLSKYPKYYLEFKL